LPIKNNFEQPRLFRRIKCFHGYLVEISKQFVFSYVYSTVVSDCYSCLIITKYLILLNLREGRARTDDARPLILMDLIVTYMGAAVKQYNSITVVVDVVMLYPAEPSLDAEYAFGSRLINQIVQNDCVC